MSIRSAGLWVVMAASACLTACGDGAGLEGPPGAAPTIGVRKDPGFSHQGFSHQGFSHQGFSHQGSSLVAQPVKAFSLASLARYSQQMAHGSNRDLAYLVEGSLRLYASRAAWSSSLSTCAATTYGLWRSCGWENAGVGYCSPGSTVKLAPGGVCGGSCTGDPMVRICRGETTCAAGDAHFVAQNDDACGTLCPSITFACPAGNYYTVMTGAYASGATSNVTLMPSTGIYPYYTTHEGAALAGAMIDAELSTGGTVPFRLSSAHPELAQHLPKTGYAGTTWRYEVEVQNATTGDWEPLCGPDDPEPSAPTGRPVAIPVSGYWDASGARIDDPDRFTFSCRTGVVAKCYRWGYRPWAWAPSSSGGWVTLKDHHQACTRMARADYCGDGRTWTQDGTEINLWDLKLSSPIQKEDTSRYLPFEAAWDPGGAACVSHARWDSTPEFVKSCPRISTPNGPLLCDDMNDVWGYYSAALFANRSNINVAQPQ